METNLTQHLRQIQPKIHGAAFGMTLGLGTLFVSQGCPASGL